MQYADVLPHVVSSLGKIGLACAAVPVVVPVAAVGVAAASGVAVAAGAAGVVGGAAYGAAKAAKGVSHLTDSAITKFKNSDLAARAEKRAARRAETNSDSINQGSHASAAPAFTNKASNLAQEAIARVTCGTPLEGVWKKKSSDDRQLTNEMDEMIISEEVHKKISRSITTNTHFSK